MNRKFPAVLLALSLAVGLCACGGQTAEKVKNAVKVEEPPAVETSDRPSIKVGLVCDGPEDDQSETYNFIRGRNDAAVMLTADGIGVEWRVRWDVEENSACADANRELAAEGCQLIFNRAPGFEPFMLDAATEYPDVEFVSCGGSASRDDGLPNTHNASANIDEGRYLTGIVAGMKLRERIDAGEIAPGEAVIGYVGAPDSAEVASACTAYLLGARSVCPGVTMKVRFAAPYSDAERDAASALADMGCQVLAQHSDNPALVDVARSAGVLHTGCNHNLTVAAPETSLVSTRVDWSVYIEHAIRTLLDGGELEQDWRHGLDLYAVELTPLNRDLIADGTDEALDEAKAALADGSLQVSGLDGIEILS